AFLWPRPAASASPSTMVDFARYDTRNYPTVPVQQGYEAWAPSYEDTVLDLMDLRLAERLGSIDWTRVGNALDFACGAERVGTCLKERGVAAVDGIDLTPAMLERAKARDAYRRLDLGDVTATGLPDGTYGLITQSLADEHMESLEPVYREAARLTNTGG